MKKIILAVAFVFSSLVHAQVDQEVKNLLNQIRAQLNHSHDQRTLLRVRERLEGTLQLLTGDGPTPGPTPTPRNMVSCIARDNDGRDPWILAVRDPSTLAYTKLPNSNVGSLANCEQVKNTVVQVRDSYFSCISKDYDGRDPWVIAHYRDGALISKVNNLGTLPQCLQALQGSFHNRQAIAFCGTKDNDGRAPWMQISVIEQTGEIHRSGSYSSLEQCQSSKLKQKLNKKL